MYNDSMLVLESTKLIGGKLMEQAGMIITYALWLLVSWQSEGAVT